MYQYGGYMPQMPVPQAQHQSNGIVWVQGESGAKSYILPPASSAMLMDSEENRFFIKTIDQSGMPQPLRIFKYEEVTTSTRKPFESVSPVGDEFATRSDLNALEGRIMEILTKLKEETS